MYQNDSTGEPMTVATDIDAADQSPETTKTKPANRPQPRSVAQVLPASLRIMAAVIAFAGTEELYQSRDREAFQALSRATARALPSVPTAPEEMTKAQVEAARDQVTYQAHDAALDLARLFRVLPVEECDRVWAAAQDAWGRVVGRLPDVYEPMAAFQAAVEAMERGDEDKDTYGFLSLNADEQAHYRTAWALVKGVEASAMERARRELEAEEMASKGA